MKGQLNSPHDSVTMTVMMTRAAACLNRFIQNCMTSDQVSIWHCWVEAAHRHVPITTWLVPTVTPQRSEQEANMELTYLLHPGQSQALRDISHCHWFHSSRRHSEPPKPSSGVVGLPGELRVQTANSISQGPLSCLYCSDLPLISDNWEMMGSSRGGGGVVEEAVSG